MGPDEEVVVVTGKVQDEGASKLQHVGGKAGQIDTSGKLQAVRKAKPEDKGREVGYDEYNICFCYWKLDVRDGVHPTVYWIRIRSGKPVHEQSGKRTLERSQVDTLIFERNLEQVSLIRVR